MRLKEGLIINQIDDEYILIDLGLVKPVFNGMIKLNDTGKDIIELLKNKDINEDEIVSALLEKYDAKEIDIRNDVKDIIKELEKVKLLNK